MPLTKKYVRIRKPSKPLDGINHRLLREQAEAALVAQEVANSPMPDDSETQEVANSPMPDDNVTPPTRAELETKATELGISFTHKTTDAKLLKLITDSLGN